MTSTDTTKVSPRDQDGGVENTPDPAALPTKRSFTIAEKLKFVADYDALSHGEKGEYLRAHGLYSSQISEWKVARDAIDHIDSHVDPSASRDIHRLKCGGS